MNMADYYAAAGYMKPRYLAAQKVPRSRFSNVALDELPLTMAYVPMQKYGSVFEPENALEKGTLFPELDKPCVGKGACK